MKRYRHQKQSPASGAGGAHGSHAWSQAGSRRQAGFHHACLASCLEPGRLSSRTRQLRLEPGRRRRLVPPPPAVEYTATPGARQARPESIPLTAVARQARPESIPLTAVARQARPESNSFTAVQRVYRPAPAVCGSLRAAEKPQTDQVSPCAAARRPAMAVPLPHVRPASSAGPTGNRRLPAARDEGYGTREAIDLVRLETGACLPRVMKDTELEKL